MKFATADCETDPFMFERMPEPFIWGFYDGEQFRYFFETDDFVDYIKEFEGTIYAHNGGKFDWHFLLKYVEEQDGIMIINGRIAKIKIGKAELRDSFLNLPVPLSAYKKDDFDYIKLERSKRFHYMDEIVKYLKGDCVYLHEILSVNFSEYGKKLTLASSAFSTWAEKFKERKPNSSLSYYNFFKPYYYGGRVQCFEKGLINKKFKVYDIRSAYPFAMTFDHPWGMEYRRSKTIPECENELVRGFYHITAICEGVFPFRTKKGLQFPNDGIAREYHVTGWELKFALKYNLVKIIKVHSARVFKETKNFKPYVDFFYKQKENANKDTEPAKYLLAKLYLNALYGKFAQTSEDHKNYCLIDQAEILGNIEGGLDFECEIGKFALMSEKIPEKHMRFYNIVVGASITGFVRAYLAETIHNSQGVLYCDTDSIACEHFGGVVGDNLGDWDCEGTFKSGGIGGKKLYAFEYENPIQKGDKKITHKISSKGAKLNEKEILAIASGEEIEYKNIAPTFSVFKPPEFITRNIKMT
jgi:hypothetical protein